MSADRAAGARPMPAVPDPAERFRAAWAEAGAALLAMVQAEPAEAADPDRPLLVSVAEAARLLGIKRSMAYQLLGEGKLPGYRIGRRRLVSTAAIRELVQALGSPAEEPDAAGPLSPAASVEATRRGGYTPRLPEG